jgi:hypothetical protein
MAGEMSFVRNLDARIAAAEEDEASAPLSNPWIRSHGLQQINKAAKAGLRIWGFKLARDPFQTTVRGEAEYLLRERERSEIPPATLFDSRINVPKQGVRPSHVVRPLRMTPRAVDQPWDDAAALVRSCG